jgi:parallel beta-helix repeat protein
MKHLVNIFLFLFVSGSLAQQEFHVFPLDGKEVKGTPQGDGSLTNPWDLQTALSQSKERVNGGDIIWLHQGVYTGRFKSKLQSTLSNTYVTVSGYKSDKVIINGNVNSTKNYVLEVKGKNVIYKNFEVTYLGEFSRDGPDGSIPSLEGINHSSGEDCIFQNLVIHNIPGLGFGSWKATGGTIIEDCIIYNNGFMGVKRGEGEGMYIQNQSDKTRLIRNNIIFNNYYKGIEVWSASSGKNKEFVKHIDIIDNIIFNSGMPSGGHRGNIIVASNDKEGVNIAKHIKIKGNVLYHNVDLKSHKNSGKAASLTLGFIKKSLVEDVTVTNNYIIGQNNAFNIYHAKSVNIQNNTIYGGYVHFQSSSLAGLNSRSLRFNYNKYFTKNSTPFRITNDKDYSFSDWKQTFDLDGDSQWQLRQKFKTENVLKVVPLITNSNHFNIALLDENGENIIVDFSNYGIEEGMVYKIYDIENRNVVVKSGKTGKDLKIEFPMGLKTFEMPLHNSIAKKSSDNFGVFRIEFKPAPKKKGLFERLFGWLF